MRRPALCPERVRRSPTKIVLVVLEGLGDIPFRGRTALEAADCACMDKLASESECGLLVPCSVGFTPTPPLALLALFGYDPTGVSLPRGAIDALVAGEPLDAVTRPSFQTFTDRYQLRPAAIAQSPLARGLAELVGMTALEAGDTLDTAFEALHRSFARHDFFFLHLPLGDGHDPESRFQAKAEAIEAFDHHLPGLLALEPDVIAITGDYARPAALGQPSWHAVPFLIWSRYTRYNRKERFTELECATGLLGRISALDAMPLLLANALKLMPEGL